MNKGMSFIKAKRFRKKAMIVMNKKIKGRSSRI